MLMGPNQTETAGSRFGACFGACFFPSKVTSLLVICSIMLGHAIGGDLSSHFTILYMVELKSMNGPLSKGDSVG